MRKITVEGLSFHELEDGSLFPVLAGAKGDAPGPAAPSPEERRLQGIQADSASESLKIAKQQQAENEALMPVLLDQQGLSRTVDPTTGTTAVTLVAGLFGLFDPGVLRKPSRSR